MGGPASAGKAAGRGVRGADWGDSVNHDFFTRAICNSGGFFGWSRGAATVEGLAALSFHGFAAIAAALRCNPMA